MQRSRFPKLVHAARIGILIAIILVIRAEHQAALRSGTAPIQLDPVQRFFPTATELVSGRSADEYDVVDEKAVRLGSVRQTSPASDRIVGFSGSTNVLIAFDANEQVVGISVLSSGDTREHLHLVESDSRFMGALIGLEADTAREKPYDAVSGATLTSLAIQEAIAVRLGATGQGSLRFPDPPSIDAVQRIFPNAETTEQVESRPLYRVLDRSKASIGWILRTAPSADDLVGYQGPTDALIGLELDAQEALGKVVGIAINASFDNSRYVGYVRDDDYFRQTFNGLLLEQLATADLYELQVEGVSGATMTSMNVADGIVSAAKTYLDSQVKSASHREQRTSFWSRLSIHDFGTVFVVLVGSLIGSTRLRGHRSLARFWKVILVGYLGLIAGNLLSVAMFFGWAQSGIPTRNAIGLVCLAAAAILLPIFTKRNIYCTHLCPHGALQQLVKPGQRRRIRLGRYPKMTRLLAAIPALLLLWSVLVTIIPTLRAFRLVDIEPFDAYHFRIAGWATISIAISGLIFSCFVPMGYCRFGCPTGSLLSFLRYHSRADRLGRRDLFAVGLLALALAIRLAR